MEVFIFFEFSDERMIFITKMCSQFNVSVSSLKSFYSFAKNNENMICKLRDYRWRANILLWNVGIVSLKIAPMIVTQTSTLWLGLGSHNIFVKCWVYCQKTQQIGFRAFNDFEITGGRYFADNILGEPH